MNSIFGRELLKLGLVLARISPFYRGITMAAMGQAASSKKPFVDLGLVFLPPPMAEIKTGFNTASVFASAASPTAGIPDVASLRRSVEDWDNHYALPYPESISSEDFHEELVVNISSSVYRTPGGDASTPTILLIHGGGFFCELPNVFKSLLAHISTRVPCHAVMPYYSLSPEVKAPRAMTEVTDVLESLLREPEKYGLTKNIILIGSSSGGSLAWNALLNLLNNPLTKALVAQIAHFILISPWVDISMETTENSPFKDQQDKDIFLQTSALERMRDFYLPPGLTGKEPEISPVYRPTHEFMGMPRTTVIVGEIDRLFADAVCAANEIDKAKVP
ncbi:MAG: alpha/beta fold hydrolase, partial [Gammaproteobacteria bacterium]|nr:alpha/beta fold hydrolase [Gammaproteobacteria bacterium]